MHILNNGRFGMAAALSGTMKSLIAKAVSFVFLHQGFCTKASAPRLLHQGIIKWWKSTKSAQWKTSEKLLLLKVVIYILFSFVDGFCCKQNSIWRQNFAVWYNSRKDCQDECSAVCGWGTIYLMLYMYCCNLDKPSQCINSCCNIGRLVMGIERISLLRSFLCGSTIFALFSLS